MMNASNDKISMSGRDKKTKIPAAARFCLAVVLSLGIMVTSGEAFIVSMEIPDSGTSTSYVEDFSILDPLSGTSLNGQSQSVNIFFNDDDFLVGAGYTSFTMDLFINETGTIGIWPTNEYCVIGYLIDAAGNPLSTPVNFPDSGTIPAQVWPGWPYYMPDGTQYLPATKMFEAQFAGTPVYGNPAGFYVNPIIFSGVHFDIRFPACPADSVVGGRIVIANFNEPILISPNPVPVYSEYFEDIPQPTLTLTGTNILGSGGVINALSLQLAGTPGYPYILEAATNLTGQINWQPVMTNSADANGNWFITITNFSALPAEFFQVVAWPGPGSAQQ